MNIRLIELRKKLNLSQEKFAEKLSINKTSVSRMETGERNITNRTLTQICTVFNVNEEWLKTGKGDMFKETEDLVEMFGYVLNDLTELEKKFLKKYFSLPKKEREMGLKFLEKLLHD